MLERALKYVCQQNIWNQVQFYVQMFPVILGEGLCVTAGEYGLLCILRKLL